MPAEFNVNFVIKREVLKGSSHPDLLQKVAVVYFNGQEYRVMAPPGAEGHAADWAGHFSVRVPEGFDREREVHDELGTWAIKIVTEELQKRKQALKSVPADPRQEPARAPSSKIELFISHSGGDAEIAGELIHLLLLAISGLRPEVIRCTSVPGFRLEGGAKTDEQIPKELLGAKVFIGLLSHNSLRSTYVLFELGARWGAGIPLIPLLVAGMTASELKAPLSGLNAHSAAVEAHIYQLVEEVAKWVGLSLASTSVYAGQIKKLAQLSEALRQEREEHSVASAKPIPQTMAMITIDTEQLDLLADLISELQDNHEAARAPRIGDTYRRPSTEFWKNNRNKIKLPQPLRSELTFVYRQIEDWRNIAESVHPNMGSPALSATTATLTMKLPDIIEQLSKLLLP